jgi:hypothetical protein
MKSRTKTLKKRTHDEDTIAFLRWTLDIVKGRELTPGIARLLRVPLEHALVMAYRLGWESSFSPKSGLEGTSHQPTDAAQGE